MHNFSFTTKEKRKTEKMYQLIFIRNSITISKKNAL